VQLHIEAAWCDIEGVYVRGWAHCGADFIKELYLRCGDSIARVENRQSRPDVLAAFPMLPSDLCGFGCYLACPPFRPLLLGVTTSSGTIEIEIDGAAAQSVARDADVTESDDPFEDFVARMKAVNGRVVEVGARNVSPGAVTRAPRFAPECEFIGVDIHSAPEVDLVADAHFLTSAMEIGSADGVFSMAVMEHLAAPWLFAAEVNRVLRMGGLTLHVVPHSWPVHEMPNDFWRMSDSGLKELFGVRTGFEVLQAGMTTPVQMIPHRTLRHEPFLQFPFARGMAGSYILARKVSHLSADAVVWPAGMEEMREQSSQYPNLASR